MNPTAASGYVPVPARVGGCEAGALGPWKIPSCDPINRRPRAARTTMSGSSSSRSAAAIATPSASCTCTTTGAWRDFLTRLTHRQEDAEEIINDTLWIVWQRAAKFRDASQRLDLDHGDRLSARAQHDPARGDPRASHGARKRRWRGGQSAIAGEATEDGSCWNHASPSCRSSNGWCSNLPTTWIIPARRSRRSWNARSIP